VEHAVLVLLPVTFAAMLAIERRFPGRPLPRVDGWVTRGLVGFAIAAAAYGVIPPWLARATHAHAPIHVAPAALGGLAGFVAADALMYALHRALHRASAIWRWTHQLHHSAERIDVVASTFRHPLDLAFQLAALALAGLALGLAPDAAALAAYLTLSARLLAHWNVRTPQRLGWVLQRPEAHAVHHARGVHAYNYGTLTLWDIAFGTFRNPARYSSGPAGYWDGASREVGKMLVGRDVGEPDQR
jgi:sterol desaturase/sphingolipid hydroxylase (fatty acid hydroxylase superfamily)